jgi:CHAT domain-containing protein/tetratricopeptide (TPR) repeat protein
MKYISLEGFHGKVVQAIDDLIQAGSWSNAKRVVVQYPELLSNEADDLMGMLGMKELDPRHQELLQRFRELLQRCRVEGVEAAFASLIQPSTASRSAVEIPTDFEAEIQQLRELTDIAQLDPRFHLQRTMLMEDILSRLQPGQSLIFRGTLFSDLGFAYANLPIGNRRLNLQRAIAAYREALRFLDPGVVAEGYANAQNLLGNACFELGDVYLRLPIEDRAENLQQAIAAYREALRFWTPQSTPLNYASAQHNLGVAYTNLPIGDRAENLEKAIAAYREALRFWTAQSAPQDYASAQHNLGCAYVALPTGDRAENLKQAIATYREALRFRTCEAAPMDFAKTQTNLGFAYFSLPTGDRSENLQQAIAAYQEALRFWTPEDTPLDYAKTQHSLGTAYNDLGVAYFSLPTGDREENLQRAIACFREALRFFNPEATPLDYASTQCKLGLAHADLQTGERRENLEQSIAAFQEALHFFTPETVPLVYAATQHSLGTAYADLPTGNHAENLQQAIAAYHEALRFWTPQTAPLEYATTQNDLGVAYRNLSARNQMENFNQAITCFEEALRFFTTEDAPLSYAKTQYNLGSVYIELPTGDRGKNLQNAIAAFQEALRFHTPEAGAQEYSSIQTNLGIAYAKLPIGNRAENLQQAIAALHEALRFRTPEAAPLGYAKTQHNLGNAYRILPIGDRARNLQQAIAAYREALRFHTPEAAPLDYASTQTNLGIAYTELPIGDRGENLKRAIAAYREALRFHSPKTAPLDYALAHNGLGIAYANLRAGAWGENLRTAITHFREALRFWTAEAAPLDYARAQSNLGVAFNDLPTGDRAENLQRAIAAYDEALRFWTPEAAPLDYANTQHNLGIAYADLPNGDRAENLQRAIAAYDEALRFRTPEATPMDFAKTQYSLGKLHSGERRWEQAHRAYASAISARETLYHAAATEIARQAVQVEAANLFSDDAYCLARLGRVREAVERLEAGKTRALAEALARDRAALAQADPSDWAAFEAARDRIKTLEVKARVLGAGVSDSGAARQFLQISADLSAARLELAAVVKRIQAYLSEFMPEGLDYQAIAAAAALDRPLVYLITTLQGSLGLIVPSEAKALIAECCVWIENFNSHDLDRLLMQRDANGNVTGGFLFGQVEGDVRILQTELDQALPRLRERLVGPLAARLVELGYHQTVLIPGGLLSLLPLSAAAFKTTTMTFAPSARAWQAAKQAAIERAGSHPVLLGIGNPLPNPHPLAFARSEVEAIAHLFRTSAQRLLIEHQATRADTLKQIVGATYLHFSCHGAFNVKEPLDSTLCLSGDERLTLRDLLDGHLDLSHARLAVLSACQTGIIDFNRVPDEAVGLPAGFLQAGVPGVVSSLWRVDDLSTGLLMGRFYLYHLKRCLDPTLALYRAQRWLRNATAKKLGLADLYEKRYRESGQRDRQAYQAMGFYQKNPQAKPFSHPYFWAAFVYSGS